MLKLIQIGNSLPASFLCDPSAEFLPGMIAELNVFGNVVMATVSSGLAPIGIIDDIKTNSFTRVSWNETVIVPAEGVVVNNQIVSVVDIMKDLDNPHILPSSFLSTVPVALNARNGIVTFPAGTPLNIDLTGAGYPNGIKAIVNYTYKVPNIPGDDSTAGSNRVTVWFDRGFFATDQFESNQQYPVRANLFVSPNGLLTTQRPSEKHPAVAIVTGPPIPMNPTLEFMWL